jgi:hypothetical protein
MNALRSKGELVISMTLAETFLLLVFMLWYSIRPKIPIAPPTRIEVLKKENQELAAKVEKLQHDLIETRSRLELWQKRFDQIVPGSDAELRKALLGGGRGKPKCQDDNLLLAASSIKGTTTVRVLADNAVLRARLIPQHVDFRAGATITTPSDIDSVLLQIAAFRNGSPQGGECKFDYSFTYATYEDYYRGRERFEKYLYSAKRTKLAEPGTK